MLLPGNICAFTLVGSVCAGSEAVPLAAARAHANFSRVALYIRSLLRMLFCSMPLVVSSVRFEFSRQKVTKSATWKCLSTMLPK